MFRRPFFTYSSLNENSLRPAINEHTIHIKANPVLLVGRAKFGPEITGDNAKHCPSVEVKLGIRNNLDPVIAKQHFACSAQATAQPLIL
jgi:hypothetical protein